MPTFVPVTDTEAPRSEQDESGMDKHRKWDSMVQLTYVEEACIAVDGCTLVTTKAPLRRLSAAPATPAKAMVE